MLDQNIQQLNILDLANVGRITSPTSCTDSRNGIEECWELPKRRGLAVESKIKCLGVRKSSAEYCSPELCRYTADIFDEQIF